MTTTFTSSTFSSDLLSLLSETFEKAQYSFLDEGTSFFETLAGISAAEASIPVGGKCATIAAQVAHVCFFLDLLDHFLKTGEDGPADWGEVWRTVSTVTPEAWADLVERLRSTYRRTCASIQANDRWDMEHSLGGAMAVLAHAAYHLGEIRQATCTVRS